ncbi:MAG: alanyl-tRNA editing protein AlaX [Thermoproteota archaeon]|nr:MAG: alanyl-tRNA editing protein AlaX [Candidatus Korarchaeota archaeon]
MPLKSIQANCPAWLCEGEKGKLIKAVGKGIHQMTRRLYYEDQYLKSFEAVVVDLLEFPDTLGLVLDKTAFYPEGGGQPADTGVIEARKFQFKVSWVKEEGEDVIHLGSMEGKISPGDIVRGVIDWDRRYKLMRMHTAAHLLETAVEKVVGSARVWGSGINVDHARLDFKARISSEQLPEIEEEINKLVKMDVPVIARFVDKVEAEEIMRKYGFELGREYLQLEKLRLVEVEGIRVDPCGGTHVSRTGEIGEVKLLGRKSKGAGITRIRFTVVP